MNILYVTMDPLELNTSANIRNIGLIKGLSKIGCKIDTLSLKPDSNSYAYDDSIFYPSDLINKRYFLVQSKLYSIFKNNKNKKSSILLSNKNILVSFITKCIKNFIEKIFIYDYQVINTINVKKGLVSISNYQIIISSSDPKSAHIIAKKILDGYEKEVKWIQYWGDPMYDDIALKKGKLKKVFLKYEENRLLKKADSIIYTSPLTLKMQKRLYKNERKKMYFTPQACFENEQRKKIRNNKKNVIGYFGNYDPEVRNIFPLCNAIKNFDDRLIIVGNGKVNISNNNIEIYSRVSYDKAKDMESNSDILVCVCNLSGTQIPGKIYYITGQQKPIIIIVDGENKDYLKKYFQKYNRYIICDNQTDKIIDALSQAKEEIKCKKKYIIPSKIDPINVAIKVINSIRRNVK